MLHELYNAQSIVTAESDKKYGYNPLPETLICRFYWIESLEAARDFIMHKFDF